MKPFLLALAVIGLVGSLGTAQWAQISGQWELDISLLPTVGLNLTTVTLSYTLAGWTISSISTFDASGFVDQQFSLFGQLSVITVTGGVNFNPLDDSTVVVSFPAGCTPQTISYTLTPPEYKSSWLRCSVALGGAEVSAAAYHWAFPYYPGYEWPCCQTPSAPAFMRYVLEAQAGPFQAVANFEDCCSGITFKDLTLSLTGLSPCCGIAFGVEFYFTKAGFEYVLLSMDNFSLCCGIGFDATLKLTETGKEITLTPKWVGFGEICYEIYGNVLFDSGQITGLEIYGYRICCSFTECTSVEFVEAFDVVAIEEILGDVFQGDEFEYVKLSFCGTGCCGGEYQVEVWVFFQSGGSLFGMSRAHLDIEVPILANMVFTSSFGITITGDPELDVGWVISF